MEDFTDIEKEIQWFKSVLTKRAELVGHNGDLLKELSELTPPPLSETSSYARLIAKYNFGFAERITLILALAPHIYPKILDIFIDSDKRLTGWGGKITADKQYFLPTGETLMFILAGRSISKRLEHLSIFDKGNNFYKENLVYLEEPDSGEPELSGVLTASTDLIDLVTRGYIRKADLRPDFPAKLLKTEMSWEEMILPQNTLNQISELELWLQHNQILSHDNKIGKKIKPGFRALFYGPPGTGKTLSACLIGKKTGRDVYRVDLSTIVSKYIGETEKNLAKLFDRAEKKDWILFFDEADALFGKRTNVSDSHDRYANQEVSYLLQRIEYHEGLVILATNMKSNMDSAFLRRFQTIVYFPLPKPEERLLLWQKAFSESIPADKSIQLNEIAKKYELSGSLILNIVSHTTLKAINEKSAVITSNMLMEGITRELAKEGRTI